MVRGERPVIIEPKSRRNHTCLGWFALSPQLRCIHFRCFLQREGMRFEHLKVYLTELHREYGKKLIIVWDNLPAHHKARLYFEAFYPDWFEFYHLPTYAPELNPVEMVWSNLKGKKLVNQVFEKTPELYEKVRESVNEVNQDKVFMKGCFKHANMLM
jgi:transposase